MSQENQPRIISLEEARDLLGENVVIAVEPSGQWVFDPSFVQIRRLDNRLFDVRMFDRGAFVQPGIYEEPGIPDPEPGQPRIIGNVKLSVNSEGKVRTVIRRSLDNIEFRQATLSSLSNPDLVEFDERAVRTALVHSNPQRIGGGYMRVFLVEEDLPDKEGEEYVSVDELKKTTDGRTLAALAALGF